MARTKLPWFQFWAEEWLLDREVVRLPVADQGVLVHLFCVSWVHGGITEDDLAPIAAALRVDKEQIRSILDQFYDSQDGTWTHHRQTAAMAEQERLRQQRSNAGRTSAQRKANDRSTPVDRPLQRNPNTRSTIESESQIESQINIHTPETPPTPWVDCTGSQVQAMGAPPQYPAIDISAIVAKLTAAKRRQA